MEAKIIGENTNGIGVDVTDNKETVHEISVEKENFEIVYHNQDDYPDDPNDRTGHDNEMVRQARDYAKWYVHQETEHDTCPWYLNCDRIEDVKTAIAGLSDEELREYFEGYYRQLAGKYDDEISRPHPDPVPAGKARNKYREYKLDIYLTDDGDIDATSGVHTMYYAGINDDRLIKTEDPYPDRTPDGRLEHVPLDIQWDQFDTFLEYHLGCQLRDCYLARGQDPPNEYRVLGPGTDHMMVRCMTRDLLPAYHEYDANIDGYRAEDTFNAGVFAPLMYLL
jgi:hypothetical protein